MFKEMQDSLLMAGWSWISDHCRKVTYSDMMKPMSSVYRWKLQAGTCSTSISRSDGNGLNRHSRSKNPGWTFWSHIQQSCWGPMLPSKGYLCFLFLFPFVFLRQGVTLKPRLDWNSGQSSSLSLPSGGIETLFKAKVNRKGWPYPICKLRMMKSREKRFNS